MARKVVGRWWLDLTVYRGTTWLRAVLRMPCDARPVTRRLRLAPLAFERAIAARGRSAGWIDVR